MDRLFYVLAIFVPYKNWHYYYVFSTSCSKTAEYNFSKWNIFSAAQSKTVRIIKKFPPKSYGK